MVSAASIRGGIIGFAGWLLVAPAWAADLSLASEHHAVRSDSIRTSIHLEGIGWPEALGGRRAVPVSAPTTSHPVGGELQSSPSALVLESLPEWIERDLPRLWRVHLGPDERMADIRIDARWHGINTEAGPAVPIQVQLTGPRRIASSERGDVWEGGVILRIPITRIRKSGTLRGELRMDLRR